MRAQSVFVPDHFTSPFVVRACRNLRCLRYGQGVHGLLIKLCLEVDVSVKTSLIEFYRSFGDMGMAKTTFDEILVIDVVPSSALSSGYVNGDMKMNARKGYCCMEYNDYRVSMKNWDVDVAREFLNKAPVKDINTQYCVG
ncbi:hypothetical protein GIB67_030798 [Kingdonia uniflora]|uniref:Pentatricopeptide repeat-containing protein n=1 Tax=Kingdonia uniflora TaxID=39325 RepID=A0A7J7L395_9MAGN|nr:hypothetical protein GIB67_030798 [Kingdonia uniflora]